MPLFIVVSAGVPGAGCGSPSAGSGGGGAGGADGGAASTPSSGPSTAARIAAVQATLTANATCASIPNFYWEMGNVQGALASGKVGVLYSATTPMNIASASKFVFGAYVVERFKTNLGAVDLSAMRMLSGYTSFNYDSCLGASTVGACLAAGSNGTHTAANDGRFDYGGGHFQKYAVDLGLGADDDGALASAIKGQVGTEFSFTYASPQLAAGIKTTAADYAAFLRKILAGGLALHDHLGENAVCTLPSACPSAVSSPAPYAWHYSYGHWVEDEPSTGDGAFSSPGAYGFYPWIDATRTYYGILARYALTPQAYVESAQCGRALRKAFLTGSP